MERWGGPGVRDAVLAHHRTLEIVLNLTSWFIKQFHMHYLICASQKLYQWDKYHHLGLCLESCPPHSEGNLSPCCGRGGPT